MQSVLSPIVGRLSDVLDRKYLASIPPLIAFAGAVISARATSMSMLIGGGILIGVTLSTIAIVQAIPSEVLPLKYRALANGFAFLGGAVGGLYVKSYLRALLPLLTTLLCQSWHSRFRWRHEPEPFRLARHFLDASCLPPCNVLWIDAVLPPHPSFRLP